MNIFTDTKNSVGLIGCIEEVSHNAIAVYWNPLESPAKVSNKFYLLRNQFWIKIFFGKTIYFFIISSH